MSDNRFGKLFSYTSWGESHGPAIGCVIDGCPAGIELELADIQAELDRRRPGTSRHTTQRREPDQVEILSGVYAGRTLGTPISLLIRNQDARSRDYQKLQTELRPGHGDLTYLIKYGHRDPNGGGRASARETAARVAAGAVAKTALRQLVATSSAGRELTFRAALVQLGELEVAGAQKHQASAAMPSASASYSYPEFNWDEVSNNSLNCPDAASVPRWEQYLDRLRRAGDSCGGVIFLEIAGLPPGLGEPIYGKLDSELAAAMISINAAKGVEFGAGFNLSASRGSAVVDSPQLDPGFELASKDEKAKGRVAGDIAKGWRQAISSGAISFRHNHQGGIWAGISTGQPLTLRVAFKPTSSIRIPVDSITTAKSACKIVTTGRHDPCVAIRAVPIVEAMAAIVILDLLLQDRARS